MWPVVWALVMVLSPVVHADVDMTGRWRTRFDVSPLPARVEDFVQTGAALVATSAGTGASAWTGTIDPATGVFALTGDVVGCAVAHFDGSVAPDGQSLDGTITIGLELDGVCVPGPIPVTGERTPPDCGDGDLDAGEQCDDGNGVERDGCDAFCRFEPGCPQVPLAGCFRSTRPQRSKIVLEPPFTVGWSWSAGEDVAAEALGDPTAATRYDLCVYDGDRLIAAGAAPAGGLCGGQACWRRRGDGFTHRNRDAVSGRLMRLTVQPGVGGRARISAKGRRIALPTLPLAEPVALVVQLKTDVLTCWETTYGPSGVQRNTAKRLVAAGTS